MSKTIGYIPGGFKPFHKGHYATVMTAAHDCDEVNILASIKDRAREGEFSISGEAMKQVWEKFIIPILPTNVIVLFTDQPIRYAFKFIYEAEAANNGNRLIFYGGPEELNKNFRNIAKAAPNLIKNNLIELREAPRLMSGTKMRQFLKLGLVDDFISGLPEPLKVHGYEIFKILGGEEV